jgi:formate-dependent nitrite reductase membrane component NrfD
MTNVFPQSKVDFSVGYKNQTTWGFQEGLTFVLEGLGATLFFVALLADNVWGMAGGVVVLAASGVLLMMHLGRPRNMIYVMANFRHSWMSRGAVLIPLFIGLGFVLVVAQGVLGWTVMGGWRVAIEIVVLMLTLFTVMKSGLVLSTFPAIAFWNGGLLPVIFGLSGLSAGLAIFGAFDGFFTTQWIWLVPALTAGLLVTLAIHLITMNNAGRAAKVSVGLIRTRHALPFYGGAMGLGLVLPLGLGIYAVIVPGDATTLLWVAIAALRLLGDIVLRDVLLKVGVFDKVR